MVLMPFVATLGFAAFMVNPAGAEDSCASWPRQKATSGLRDQALLQVRRALSRSLGNFTGSAGAASGHVLTGVFIEWAAHPDKCLQVSGASPHNGNDIVLWDCADGHAGQRFKIPAGGSGQIRWAAHPHKCLDVSGGAVHNGNQIQLWDCVEHEDNQEFVIPTRRSHRGKIRWQAHLQMCLDVTAGVHSNGNRIQLWQCTKGERNQQFAIRSVSEATTTALSSARSTAMMATTTVATAAMATTTTATTASGTAAATTSAVATTGPVSAATTTSVAATTMTTTTTPTRARALDRCIATYKLPSAVNTASKGINVDDATFFRCPGGLPRLWPNTYYERVKSLRLFKAWHPDWGSDDRRVKVWADLVAWIRANDVTVLIGTDITCDAQADSEMWRWSLELMKLIGEDRIIGVAVGNDMDVIRHANRTLADACNAELWHHRYWQTLLDRVGDLDSNGFPDTRVTIIWSMSVMVQSPWRDTEGWQIRKLVSQAHAKWRHRWVWSFNVYAIWDGSRWPVSEADCKMRAAAAMSIRYTKAILRVARLRISGITGTPDDTLWVFGAAGSTGTLSCDAFFNPVAIQHAYEQFMSWDLSLGMGLRGPARAFFFTAHEHGAAPRSPRGFGLVRSCSDRRCTIQHAA
uniref:Ricin B lectin domain-containing protein n=1 Tax=Pyrodinium bahamense TaxID=73915 RepID=A0A7S0FI73_9DINO|mmetsp:Transcript_33168/g.91692  ORF Transcript_33168/g.91692 Transcript_33168/m.91692 type:complete len:635 (+) Transcript_33168:74-1978(+)